MQEELFTPRENQGIERLIDNYIELEESKRELEKQQQIIKIIVKRFFKENPSLHEYRTPRAEVKIKTEKNKTTELEKVRLVELAIENNLRETLMPVWNKRLRKYLAIKKKDFEIYRQHNLADYKQNKYMQDIRDILISKDKLELLTFNREILKEVIDMMIYDQKQKNCAATILKSLEYKVISFKKINKKSIL